MPLSNRFGPHLTLVRRVHDVTNGVLDAPSRSVVKLAYYAEVSEQSCVSRHISDQSAVHGAECSSAVARPDGYNSDGPRASIFPDEERPEEPTRVVGPILGRDAQIFEQYLPSTDAEERSAGLRSSVDLTVSYKPVYHAPVPRRRPSPSNCDCSRNRKAEWLSVLEPHAEKMLNLYDFHCFESIVDLTMPDTSNIFIPPYR